MNILGAIVESAKALAVIILLLTFAGIFKNRLPRHIRNILRCVTAATFFITFLGSNFEQFITFFTLNISRVATMACLVFGSFITYMVFVLAVHYTALKHGISLTLGRKFNLAVQKYERISKCEDIKASNSFLEITPILLS